MELNQVNFLLSAARLERVIFYTTTLNGSVVVTMMLLDAMLHGRAVSFLSLKTQFLLCLPPRFVL